MDYGISGVLTVQKDEVMSNIMFAYNLNKNDRAMYITLPDIMKFDFSFHNGINEMLYMTLVDTKSNYAIKVYFNCGKNSKIDNMCKAYILNVLSYISKTKEVFWTSKLKEKIISNVSLKDGKKFEKIDFNTAIQKGTLFYFQFKGDKDVQKPINEITNILVEKNLTIDSERVKEFLSTTIGEIFSNSVNHSEQDTIYFLCDIEHEKDGYYLRINVMDYGTTIVKNVRDYFAIVKAKKCDDIECLKWAIELGNTTRQGSGGYGLPTLISYIKSTKGTLFIISGRVNYVLDAGKEKVEYSDGVFFGTSITFKVKLYNTSQAITINQETEELISVSLDSI